MSWFLLSISAALCWAAGSTLVKKGFETIPPLWNNIINNALTIFLYIPAAFIVAGHKTLSFHSFLFVAAASLLYQIFYYAISKGQISLTGTLVAGYPVFTILLAHIFI
ncbi:MAG: EamA family transporter, partial [Spirochaetales bacterium]|nr:EamA family transporter [Spirochaetales bacterium]